MKVDIITLFPEICRAPLSESMMKRAQESGALELQIHDLRRWTTDKHHVVDDAPFGGGPGMVMKPEPIFAAVEELQKTKFTRRGGNAEHRTPNAEHRTSNAEHRTLNPERGTSNSESKIENPKSKVLLMSPTGRHFDQQLAMELSHESHLIIVCGHYEGVDHRVVEHLVDFEISIGDYVLTNGAIAAVVLVDAVARLLPNVLGHELSASDDSFAAGMLEGPQYTRPAEFRGWKVPDVLLSGNHAKIAAWRKKEAERRTRQSRPDLLGEKDSLG
jgi:tRNA (guanine37-N1)-methyltransferase